MVTAPDGLWAGKDAARESFYLPLLLHMCSAADAFATPTPAQQRRLRQHQHQHGLPAEPGLAAHALWTTLELAWTACHPARALACSLHASRMLTHTFAGWQEAFADVTPPHVLAALRAAPAVAALARTAGALRQWRGWLQARRARAAAKAAAVADNVVADALAHERRLRRVVTALKQEAADGAARDARAAAAARVGLLRRAVRGWAERARDGYERAACKDAARAFARRSALARAVSRLRAGRSAVLHAGTATGAAGDHGKDSAPLSQSTVARARRRALPRARAAAAAEAAGVLADRRRARAVAQWRAQAQQDAAARTVRARHTALTDKQLASDALARWRHKAAVARAARALARRAAARRALLRWHGAAGPMSPENVATAAARAVRCGRERAMAVWRQVVAQRKCFRDATARATAVVDAVKARTAVRRWARVAVGRALLKAPLGAFSRLSPAHTALATLPQLPGAAIANESAACAFAGLRAARARASASGDSAARRAVKHWRAHVRERQSLRAATVGLRYVHALRRLRLAVELKRARKADAEKLRQRTAHAAKQRAMARLLGNAVARADARALEAEAAAAEPALRRRSVLAKWRTAAAELRAQGRGAARIAARVHYNSSLARDALDTWRNGYTARIARLQQCEAAVGEARRRRVVRWVLQWWQRALRAKPLLQALARAAPRWALKVRAWPTWVAATQERMRLLQLGRRWRARQALQSWRRRAAAGVAKDATLTPVADAHRSRTLMHKALTAMRVRTEQAARAAALADAHYRGGARFGDSWRALFAWLAAVWATRHRRRTAQRAAVTALVTSAVGAQHRRARVAAAGAFWAATAQRHAVRALATFATERAAARKVDNTVDQCVIRPFLLRRAVAALKDAAVARGFVRVRNARIVLAALALWRARTALRRAARGRLALLVAARAEAPARTALAVWRAFTARRCAERAAEDAWTVPVLALDAARRSTLLHSVWRVWRMHTVAAAACKAQALARGVAGLAANAQRRRALRARIDGAHSAAAARRMKFAITTIRARNMAKKQELKHINNCKDKNRLRQCARAVSKWRQRLVSRADAVDLTAAALALNRKLKTRRAVRALRTSAAARLLRCADDDAVNSVRDLSRARRAVSQWHAWVATRARTATSAAAVTRVRVTVTAGAAVAHWRRWVASNTAARARLKLASAAHMRAQKQLVVEKWCGLAVRCAGEASLQKEAVAHEKRRALAWIRARVASYSVFASKADAAKRASVAARRRTAVRKISEHAVAHSAHRTVSLAASICLRNLRVQRVVAHLRDLSHSKAHCDTATAAVHRVSRVHRLCAAVRTWTRWLRPRRTAAALAADSNSKAVREALEVWRALATRQRCAAALAALLRRRSLERSIVALQRNVAVKRDTATSIDLHSLTVLSEVLTYWRASAARRRSAKTAATALLAQTTRDTLASAFSEWRRVRVRAQVLRGALAVGRRLALGNIMARWRAWTRALADDDHAVAQWAVATGAALPLSVRLRRRTTMRFHNSVSNDFNYEYANDQNTSPALSPLRPLRSLSGDFNDAERVRVAEDGSPLHVLPLLRTPSPTVLHTQYIPSYGNTRMSHQRRFSFERVMARLHEHPGGPPPRALLAANVLRRICHPEATVAFAAWREWTRAQRGRGAMMHVAVLRDRTNVRAEVLAHWRYAAREQRDNTRAGSLFVRNAQHRGLAALRDRVFATSVTERAASFNGTLALIRATNAIATLHKLVVRRKTRDTATAAARASALRRGLNALRVARLERQRRRVERALAVQCVRTRALRLWYQHVAIVRAVRERRAAVGGALRITTIQRLRLLVRARKDKSAAHKLAKTVVRARVITTLMRHVHGRHEARARIATAVARWRRISAKRAVNALCENLSVRNGREAACATAVAHTRRNCERDALRTWLAALRDRSNERALDTAAAVHAARSACRRVVQALQLNVERRREKALARKVAAQNACVRAVTALARAARRGAGLSAAARAGAVLWARWALRRGMSALMAVRVAAHTERLVVAARRHSALQRRWEDNTANSTRTVHAVSGNTHHNTADHTFTRSTRFAPGASLARTHHQNSGSLTDNQDDDLEDALFGLPPLPLPRVDGGLLAVSAVRGTRSLAAAQLDPLIASLRVRAAVNRWRAFVARRAPRRAARVAASASSAIATLRAHRAVLALRCHAQTLIAARAFRSRADARTGVAALQEHALERRRERAAVTLTHARGALRLCRTVLLLWARQALASRVLRVAAGAVIGAREGAHTRRAAALSVLLQRAAAGRLLSPAVAAEDATDARPQLHLPPHGRALTLTQEARARRAARAVDSALVAAGCAVSSPITEDTPVLTWEDAFSGDAGATGADTDTTVLLRTPAHSAITGAAAAAAEARVRWHLRRDVRSTAISACARIGAANERGVWVSVPAHATTVFQTASDVVEENSDAGSNSGAGAVVVFDATALARIAWDAWRAALVRACLLSGEADVHRRNRSTVHAVAALRANMVATARGPGTTTAARRVRRHSLATGAAMHNAKAFQARGRAAGFVRALQINRGESQRIKALCRAAVAFARQAAGRRVLSALRVSATAKRREAATVSAVQSSIVVASSLRDAWCSWRGALAARRKHVAAADAFAAAVGCNTIRVCFSHWRTVLAGQRECEAKERAAAVRGDRLVSVDALRSWRNQARERTLDRAQRATALSRDRLSALRRGVRALRGAVVRSCTNNERSTAHFTAVTAPRAAARAVQRWRVLATIAVRDRLATLAVNAQQRRRATASARTVLFAWYRAMRIQRALCTISNATERVVARRALTHWRCFTERSCTDLAVKLH